MKIIHLFCLPQTHFEKLYFWAEDTDLFEKNSPSYSETTHPFCLPQLELIHLFQDRMSLRENWGFENILMFFPKASSDGRPFPSKNFEDLLKEKSKNSEVFSLTKREYRIRSVSISMELLWRFFPQMLKTSYTDMEFSSSILFFKELLRFVLQLLKEQFFFPKVSAKKGHSTQCLGQWQPYFSERQRAVFQGFCDAVPESLFPSKEISLSTQSIQKYLWNLVKNLSDSFIRKHVDFFSFDSQIFFSLKKNHSLVENWMQSLFSQSAVVKGNSREIDQFVQNFSQWIALFPQSFFSPITLCFELLPPSLGKHSEKDWTLLYRIRDNSLENDFVPSSVFFSQKNKNFSKYSAFIFEEFQKISTVFSDFSPLLDMEKCQELILDKKKALFFLQTVFPILSHLGYPIFWPSFWKNRSRKPLEIVLSSDEGENFQESFNEGINSHLKLRIGMNLGDHKLSEKEIFSLLQTKDPLVQLGGEWNFVDTEKIMDTMKFFEKKEGLFEISLRDYLSLDFEDKVPSHKIFSFKMDTLSEEGFQWIREPLLMKKISVSKDFKGTLRPYQILGVSWLMLLQKRNLGACLADDMGLGKTVQVIALILKERELDSQPFSPTLVLCPMSILNNWKKEFQTFSPHLKVFIYHGTKRPLKEDFLKIVFSYDVVITTYSLVAPELETLQKVFWHRIILDEAQNIKNISAHQTRAIKTLACKYKIAMTGTPIENKLLELWSIMDFLNPNHLGSSRNFYLSYCVPIEKYNDKTVSEKLKKQLRPFILRRVKTDKSVIKDLPEKIEYQEECFLTKEQIFLYQSVFNQVFKQINNSTGNRRRGLVLSLLIKLKQICNHPVHYLKDDSSLEGRSGKLTRLCELLTEVSDLNEKSLIFTQFANMGLLLKKYLEQKFGKKVLFFHGGVKKEKRVEMIEKFQSNDLSNLFFVLSLRAGGLGVNLTSANHVFHFDRWWNPATENQATDRSFRIGQKKIVYVHKFLCHGTIEERISKMILKKRKLSNMIVGERPSRWISELSNEEIYRLCEINEDLS